jgi:hypothetical protein
MTLVLNKNSQKDNGAIVKLLSNEIRQTLALSRGHIDTYP